MQTNTAVLFSKTVLTESVLLFKFTTSSSSFIFVPGQYIILNVPSGGFLKRLYSIASSSGEKNSFELLIKLVPGGRSSTFLSSLKTGDLLEFQGPAGVFALKETPLNKVFFATGTGLAPIRRFLLSNPTHTRTYSLYWGIRTISDLYLMDELIGLAEKDARFHLRFCLSKETSLNSIAPEKKPFFSIGRINTIWEKDFLPSNKTCEYYICGRREMVESVREYLYNHNIDRDLVYFERY